MQLAVTDETSAETATEQEPTWALVSIRNADQQQKRPWAFATTGPRLNLFFDDYTSPAPTGPQRAHAQAAWAFARTLAREPPPGLIVHCAAGISRSSATMLGIQTALGQDPAQALAALATAGRTAWNRGWRFESRAMLPAVLPAVRRRVEANPLWLFMPNAVLVRHFDDLAGRGGALCAAVASAFATPPKDQEKP